MIRPEISARRIGQEGRPVIVVDGFHPDPDALRTHAVASRFEPARHHYPGVRADLPPDYFALVRPALGHVLAEVFGNPNSVELLDASFSIVTTPPDALTLAQRLPHVDAVVPGRIALVHYLSPEGGDGTAFFRHRATGFELVDEARAVIYYPQLDAELRRGGEPPARYISASTPLFERIGGVDARYNRAVIYRSAMLHSGAIGAEAALSPDPAVGRLTVTAFLATR